jgi:MSHA pilin protein MshB
VSLVRAQWEAEGRAKQDSLNTVLYDGSRFYLTTPTDTQVSNGELSPAIPWTRRPVARPMWIRPA